MMGKEKGVKTRGKEKSEKEERFATLPSRQKKKLNYQFCLTFGFAKDENKEMNA